jgi:RNA helicase UPF1, 1B domain
MLLLFYVVMHYVRWDKGLNHKHIAIFRTLQSDHDIKMMQGDELKLQLDAGAARLYGRKWEGN